MHLIAIHPEAVFQALADSIRIRMLRLLAVSGEESCLCEFVDTLQQPQYKLSRHLQVLRQAGLLTAEKDGRFVYHRLVVEPAYLQSVHAALRALPDPDRVFRQDLKRFRGRMRLREGGRCRIGIQTAELVAGAG
jgi:ArsR family transcriptional regulator